MSQDLTTATIGEFEAELVVARDAAGNVAQHIKDRLRLNNYPACLDAYSRFKYSSWALPSWINASMGEFSIANFIEIKCKYPSDAAIMKYIDSMTEFDAYNLPLEHMSKTYSAVTLLRTCRGNRHALDARTYAWLLHSTNNIEKRCDKRKTSPCAVCQAMPRKVRTEFSKPITDALTLMTSESKQEELCTWMTNSKNRLSMTSTCQSYLNYHRYRYLAVKYARQSGGVSLHPKCMADVYYMINALDDGERQKSEQARLAKAARHETSGDDSASHSAKVAHTESTTHRARIDTSADESASGDRSATQQDSAEQTDVFTFQSGHSGDESDGQSPATMSSLTPRPVANSTPIKTNKRKRALALPSQPLFQSPADVAVKPVRKRTSNKAPTTKPVIPGERKSPRMHPTSRPSSPRAPTTVAPTTPATTLNTSQTVQTASSSATSVPPLSLTSTTLSPGQALPEPIVISPRPPIEATATTASSETHAPITMSLETDNVAFSTIYKFGDQLSSGLPLMLIATIAEIRGAFEQAGAPLRALTLSITPPSDNQRNLKCTVTHELQPSMTVQIETEHTLATLNASITDEGMAPIAVNIPILNLVPRTTRPIRDAITTAMTSRAPIGAASNKASDKTTTTQAVENEARPTTSRDVSHSDAGAIALTKGGAEAEGRCWRQQRRRRREAGRNQASQEKPEAVQDKHTAKRVSGGKHNRASDSASDSGSNRANKRTAAGQQNNNHGQTYAAATINDRYYRGIARTRAYRGHASER